MKKTSKILKILIAIAVVVTLFQGHNQVNAAGGSSEPKSMSDILGAASSWMSMGNRGASDLMNGQDENARVDYFATQLLGIGSVLVAIGVATLVIVSVIMEIKF